MNKMVPLLALPLVGRVAAQQPGGAYLRSLRLHHLARDGGKTPPRRFAPSLPTRGRVRCCEILHEKKGEAR
jgi:hypothetical protein